MTLEENRKKFVSDLHKITNFEHLWNFHCLLVQTPKSRMELREGMESFARTRDANGNLPFVQVRPRIRLEKNSSGIVYALYDNEWDNGRLPDELQEPWSEILSQLDGIARHSRGPGRLRVKTRLAIFKAGDNWEAAAALPDHQRVLDELTRLNRRLGTESSVPDGPQWESYLQARHAKYQPRGQRKG